MRNFNEKIVLPGNTRMWILSNECKVIVIYFKRLYHLNLSFQGNLFDLDSVFGPENHEPVAKRPISAFLPNGIERQKPRPKSAGGLSLILPSITWLWYTGSSYLQVNKIQQYISLIMGYTFMSFPFQCNLACYATNYKYWPTNSF